MPLPKICPYCNKTYSCKTSLNQHVKNIHRDETPRPSVNNAAAAAAADEKIPLSTGPEMLAALRERLGHEPNVRALFNDVVVALKERNREIADLKNKLSRDYDDDEDEEEDGSQSSQKSSESQSNQEGRGANGDESSESDIFDDKNSKTSNKKCARVKSRKSKDRGDSTPRSSDTESDEDSNDDSDEGSSSQISNQTEESDTDIFWGDDDKKRKRKHKKSVKLMKKFKVRKESSSDEDDDDDDESSNCSDSQQSTDSESQSVDGESDWSKNEKLIISDNILDALIRLRSKSIREKRLYISICSDEVIHCLGKLAENLIMGDIKLTNSQFNKLSCEKWALRELADDETCLARKRQILEKTWILDMILNQSLYCWSRKQTVV